MVLKKLLIIMLLFLPLFISAQKKSRNTIKKISGESFAMAGKSQLQNGDTIHACINFLKAKALGYYRLNFFYNENEEESEDDVILYCYDEKNQIKKALRDNPEFKILNYPPLDFFSAEIFNDELGTPTLKLQMHNNSAKIVDAFKCVVKCYNRFDEAVKGIENSNTGIITDQARIDPGEDGGNIEGYSFTFFSGISKMKLTLLKVHFQDGSNWVPKVGQIFTSTATSPL